MSMGPILRAVKAELLTAFTGSNDNEIDIMPGPEPKPIRGQRFISIYGNNQINPNPGLERGRREQLGVAICITVTTSPKPAQAYWKSYIDGANSIDQTAEVIKNAIHNNHAIVQAAQAIVNADPILDGQYSQSLNYESMDPRPTEAGSSWFTSSMDPEDYRKPQDRQAGLYSVLIFNNLRYTRRTT